MARIVREGLEANDRGFAIAKTVRECLRERIPSSAVREITAKGGGETHVNLLPINKAEL
jgi:hypothetical protein